jgi:DNA-binding protein Fis
MRDATDTINAYFSALENPQVSDYYNEVMDGMNALVIDAVNARMHVAVCRACQGKTSSGGQIMMFAPGS